MSTLRDSAAVVSRLPSQPASLRHARWMTLLALCASAIAAPCHRAAGQILDGASSPSDVSFGPPVVVQYRVGAEVTANRGACRNVLAVVAVPLECPEQQVRLVDEDISGDAEVTYRNLQDGVRQMLMSVRYLPNGQTAKAILTFEVTIHSILPPQETKDLKIPRRLSRDVRRFTSGSPYIEVSHRKIRSLAKEVWKDLDETATDWERVEAIYDYVLDHIDYVEGPDKGALETLRDGQADCQGRSMVFIALCRANKIPARMVWVDGHAYAEFYLEDADGKGHWYPCESAGSRAFGEMPLARPIFQKGDNFEMPEGPKERLRYATDYLTGLPTRGGGSPSYKFTRERVLEEQ